MPYPFHKTVLPDPKELGENLRTGLYIYHCVSRMARTYHYIYNSTLNHEVTIRRLVHKG